MLFFYLLTTFLQAVSLYLTVQLPDLFLRLLIPVVVFPLFSEGWKVPSIRPLETLHNSLTLRQLENFLIKMTEGSFRTPVPTPPYPPSTPCSSMVNSANAQTLTNLGLTSATGENNTGGGGGERANMRAIMRSYHKEVGDGDTTDFLSGGRRMGDKRKGTNMCVECATNYY